MTTSVEDILNAIAVGVTNSGYHIRIDFERRIIIVKTPNRREEFEVSVLKRL